MLDHEEEIYARPPRTWFQTEKQKKELAVRSKAAAAEGGWVGAGRHMCGALVCLGAGPAGVTDWACIQGRQLGAGRAGPLSCLPSPILLLTARCFLCLLSCHPHLT
jgi:hypothetical protein